MAGWLLGVHWWCWPDGAGSLFWRVFLPSSLGIITVFYLTDWPAQARWLPQDERDWLVNELQAELQAKKKIRDYTITGSVLRPASPVVDRRLVPGPVGSSREHLLDTHLRETPFGLLGSSGDFAATGPSSDWNRRDADQRLALR